MVRLVLWTFTTVSFLILIQQITADDGDDGMMQKPIELTLPPDLLRKKGRNIATTPKSKRQLGQHCSQNHPCDEGLCCVRRRRFDGRSCQALAGRYRRCSDSPTKGGIYHRYCPCAIGIHACEHGYCLP
uniref:Putative secreted protein n=1 Tax=Amblyomma americanum TaxID=6943 RepID=A0A0C9SEX0_AMBAM